MLTAHTARVSSTQDGLVIISGQSVNGNNLACAGYSVNPRMKEVH